MVISWSMYQTVCVLLIFLDIVVLFTPVFSVL